MYFFVYRYYDAKGYFINTSVEIELHKYTSDGCTGQTSSALQFEGLPPTCMDLGDQGKLLSTLSNRIWTEKNSKAGAVRSMTTTETPTSLRNKVVWNMTNSTYVEAVGVILLGLHPELQPMDTVMSSSSPMDTDT